MQKLVPRSHVAIFLNERTQSTLVDPKHRLGLFHSISVHLGSFRNCMKPDAKHTELVQLTQKFMTRSHVGIFRNEHTQSTQLDPKLIFRSVSYYFGAFGIVS